MSRTKTPRVRPFSTKNTRFGWTFFIIKYVFRNHLITIRTHHVVPNVHRKVVPFCTTSVVWWRNNVQLEKGYAQYIELAGNEKDVTNTTPYCYIGIDLNFIY